MRWCTVKKQFYYQSLLQILFLSISNTTAVTEALNVPSPPKRRKYFWRNFSQNAANQYNGEATGDHEVSIAAAMCSVTEAQLANSLVSSVDD
jgi:hypothetical protein